MPEWPIGTVSKTVVQVTVPRVRIPLFPQSFYRVRELCLNVGTTLIFLVVNELR